VEWPDSGARRIIRLFARALRQAAACTGKPHATRGHGTSVADPDGKKHAAPRKQVPEPAFGITKSMLGFRHFLLRGIDRVRDEWSPVTLA
jgi:hypothetical protein